MDKQTKSLKGKFGSQLHGLRPLIGLENRFGYAPYRLVVGPLADEAAARKPVHPYFRQNQLSTDAF